MTDEDKKTEESEKSTRQKMGDGIKQGIGVLSALKDALEESIQEARDRGDLSAERAKEVVKDALGKAQAAASEARERLDFAQQGEFDTLENAVRAVKERVSALEESVFGERRGEEEADEAQGSAATEGEEEEKGS